MMPLLNVFSTLEGFMSDLYPYRYVVTPLLVVATLAGLYVAWRLGLHRPLLRHRFVTAAIAAPLLVVTLVLGNYLLSPLWERSYLEETSPLEAVVPQDTAMRDAMVPAVMTDAPAAPLPGIALQGMFKGADDFHFGRGDAQVIRTADGKHVLRFENFSVRNGPDLYVYLSVDSNGKKVEETLNLGRLKATDGAFNYEIPDHINVESIGSVIVWCRQFSTLFAVATVTSN
jgi:hypothetical protein